jgi:DNA-binding NtrC family response regulator
MFPVDLLDESWKDGAQQEPIPAANSTSVLVFPENVMPLEKLEREYILHALRQANGNRTHTAQMLGISIRTLRNKLNELKMAEDQPV